MKKTENTIIRSIDEFDESISLWQLLPTSGFGLKTLKHIVDAELNCKIDRGRKPLSLLVTGASMKKTYARAFLRALGIVKIKEIPASLLNSSQSIGDFFYSSSSSCGYIITDAHQLLDAIKLNLYQVLCSGMFRQFNYVRQCKEHFPILGTVVFTAEKKEAISESLYKNIEHHIGVGEMNLEGLILATLQRIKYSNLSYESEEVLRCIVEYGFGDMGLIVKFLKLCILLLREQNENEITMKIVEKASKLF